jgi:hypothetical protein
MARELEISIRKFRELMTLGMPYTQVQGVIWFEPDQVHAWLDQFARKGTSGVKRVRGRRVKDLKPDFAAVPFSALISRSTLCQ